MTNVVEVTTRGCVGSSAYVETIRKGPVDLNWLASNLTHAIVKRGCRDDDVIDLSERLDYVEQTGDGSSKPGTGDLHVRTPALPLPTKCDTPSMSRFC